MSHQLSTRMMGGDLLVQSWEGHGAGISFEIPYPSQELQKLIRKH
ncbi:MAG: hypothetical protein ACLP7A_16210 [Desulfobaccales bacterium]